MDGFRILLLSLLQAYHILCNEVCIYENGDETNHTDCYDVANNISDRFPLENFTIQLSSDELYLNSVLTIANRQFVMITGMPSQVICNQTDTGIFIRNVTGLVIKDVTLISCGNMFNDTYNYFMSGIYILQCTDVTIERLTVKQSNGSGMIMFDNGGTVCIRNCTFSGNKDDIRSSSDTLRGGSGLHIVLSYCGQRTFGNNCTTEVGNVIQSSTYVIESSVFQNNVGPHYIEAEEPKLLASGFSRGGGLSIILDTSSSYNSIEITHCKFEENSAFWGGGLYVVLVGDAHNNIVEVGDCVFRYNSCTSNYYAGGGALVGYQQYRRIHPQNNTVEFKRCSFESNAAGIGGGFNFYSSKSVYSPNTMTFRNVTWTQNKANIGAALNIASSTRETTVCESTEIVLSNCRFENNGLLNNIKTMRKYVSYVRGEGILLAVGYHIRLQETIIFTNNEASAMHLTSTELEVAKNANVTFFNNTAFKGGAICLLGSSTLILNDNIAIRFENNTADYVGGAIYHNSYNERDYFISRSCFIRHQKHAQETTAMNINVIFKGNTIVHSQAKNSPEQYGHSMFLVTLLPCFNSCSSKISRIEDLFSTCIGNFTFEDKNRTEISTGGNRTDMENKTIQAIPGKKVSLNITTLNDLSKEVNPTYHVKTTDVSITLESAYTSDKSIRFFGEPESEADVVLESIHSRGLVIKFHVTLRACPLGFVFENVTRKCACPLENPSTKNCNNRTFDVSFRNNYWVGYLFGDKKVWWYGKCPLKSVSELVLHNYEYGLTNDSGVICGELFHGILCSKCKKEGYAIQYNDYYYSCREAKHKCKLGWLYYFGLEIVPVTVFFVLVMTLNIQFTDGAVNGFIFFVQVSDIMLIQANGIKLPSISTETILVSYRFLSSIFNLNLFPISGKFLFCLWESASQLDMLAFRYITILYASTLVLLIIIIFKYCHSSTVNRILYKLGRRNAASTESIIIHGVSGFLVICYSECARVSFLLLTPSTLRSGDNRFAKEVVFYNGELAFFHGKHLLYAIPALLILITLGVLPPLILVSYPLCYRVMALLKISETKFAKLLCTCFPLEKFKPFFDSFQSSFKDDYRFFSGLYFIYRFTTLATYAFTYAYQYYTVLQVQLAVFFAFHAVCQPYKKRWHNILDALLLLNLSLINIITHFISEEGIGASMHLQEYPRLSAVQVTLLYLPLAYMAVYAIAKIAIRVMSIRVMRAARTWTIWKDRSSSKPGDYHRVENLSLSIAEERRLDD
jgi:predicted outer membrane repeat protein